MGPFIPSQRETQTGTVCWSGAEDGVLLIVVFADERCRSKNESTPEPCGSSTQHTARDNNPAAKPLRLTIIVFDRSAKGLVPNMLFFVGTSATATAVALSDSTAISAYS